MSFIDWRDICRSLLLGILLSSPLLSQEQTGPDSAPVPPAEPAVSAPEASAQQPDAGTAVGTPPAAEQPVDVAGPVLQMAAGPELLKRMKTKVSVDFRDAPIQDVIKTLAEQADIDIVKGPSVTGTVTAKLTDVPLDEAMESIFTVHGFGYTTSESIVRIVPKNELAQYMVKYQTKVYQICYADIEELNKAVKDMLSPQGKIAMNKLTGHLCIYDTEEKIAELDEFITEMDREIPQILVEARIYDVSSSAFQDLGVNWYAGTFTQFDPDTGLPILFDPSTGLPMVGRTDPYAAGRFNSSIGQAPKATAGVTLGFLNENVDIQAMLTARRDDVKARLLANPKILVLNGQEANINIVTEIPYQELTQTSGGGNIGTTKFKEVGVTLIVTPQITRDGKIRLMLNPGFSTQTGTVALVIPTGLTAITSPQPIVDKREARTQALIQDGQTVVIGGIMEHIEEAGVHSGDSACALPPYSLQGPIVNEIREATHAMARELKVIGLMNVQFAIQREEGRPKLYVLEVNPRASRTVPFVSKATNMPLAKAAAKVMVGVSLIDQGYDREPIPAHVSVKEAVFPFAKFAGVDVVLGPEMRSTGEVMGVSERFSIAFAKSQLAAGQNLPESGTVFISVAERSKWHVVGLAGRLRKLGYELLATRGTAELLKQAGIEVGEIKKLHEGHPNLLDVIANGELSLVINTPSGKGARTDEGRIRAAAVSHRIPCITTIQAAEAAVLAMEAMREEELSVQSVQSRFPGKS
ncbi:MAG TPA: hypothetical protein DD670_16135 [Planctomycetaceae bacterium]|nr:hypothetical protein [Planctomycetaceae bacterium]